VVQLCVGAPLRGAPPPLRADGARGGAERRLVFLLGGGSVAFVYFCLEEAWYNFAWGAPLRGAPPPLRADGAGGGAG
jgi:hypothetical protein